MAPVCANLLHQVLDLLQIMRQGLNLGSILAPLLCVLPNFSRRECQWCECEWRMMTEWWRWCDWIECEYFNWWCTHQSNLKSGFSNTADFMRSDSITSLLWLTKGFYTWVFNLSEDSQWGMSCSMMGLKRKVPCVHRKAADSYALQLMQTQQSEPQRPAWQMQIGFHILAALHEILATSGRFVPRCLAFAPTLFWEYRFYNQNTFVYLFCLSILVYSSKCFSVDVIFPSLR